MKGCGPHRIMKTCLQECSQWTLNISQVVQGSVRGKSKQSLVPMSSIPTPSIKSKLYAEPVLVVTDLITEQQVRENFTYVFGQEVDEDRSSFYQRMESYDSARVSSQDPSHLDQAKEITAHFPLECELHGQTLSVCNVIEREFAAETLLMVQFKVMADPKDSLASFRRVQPDYGSNSFKIELAGNLHGKALAK